MRVFLRVGGIFSFFGDLFLKCILLYYNLFNFNPTIIAECRWQVFFRMIWGNIRPLMSPLPSVKAVQPQTVFNRLLPQSEWLGFDRSKPQIAHSWALFGLDHPGEKHRSMLTKLLPFSILTLAMEVPGIQEGHASPEYMVGNVRWMGMGRGRVIELIRWLYSHLNHFYYKANSTL